VSRLQLKFMGALTALVVAVVFTTSLLAERGLRSREQSRLQRSLEERGRLVQDRVAGLPFELDSAPVLDRNADELAFASGARVTLIAPDGTVVGDSEVPLEQLGSIENHATRPEVIEALAGRIGVGLDEHPVVVAVGEVAVEVPRAQVHQVLDLVGGVQPRREQRQGQETGQQQHAPLSSPRGNLGHSSECTVRCPRP